MPRLMRCLYCGLLQDEPAGVKACERCGGELAFEGEGKPGSKDSYLLARMELDQVLGPSGRNFDRHLLITLQTPVEIPKEHTLPAPAGRPALTFAAVLDISGSMGGGKLAQAKEAVRRALAHLREGDVFSLVTFESKVRCVYEPAEVSAQTRKVVNSLLDKIKATGMTALAGGLEMGIRKALASQKENTLVLLLSDGQANVGETDLEKVGYQATLAREKGLIVSTIGLGMDYNEALMSEIATQGGGRFYHVSTAAQIPAYMAGELGEVAAMAAKEVKIHLDLPRGAVASPFSAAYPAQQDGQETVINVGDIPVDLELEIPIRLAIPANPAGSRLPVTGRVTYKSPAGSPIEVELNQVTVRCAAPEEYQFREGMVKQVAEVVFRHMKAANVLRFSRAASKNPAAVQQEIQHSSEALRAYADLLGEEQAVHEADEVHAMFMAPPAPEAMKFMVGESFRVMRKTRDFDKKK